MGHSVFWSWQSDQDERVTRHLIREALFSALDRLSNDSDIEERIELDHDTKGLPGSPDIVASILAKIDQARVFVADITPIAVASNGKQVGNPNVMIELGYAKKSLGTSQIVTVWNTAFETSRVEDLPFDLRGKRGPISYSLRVSASKEELAVARSQLVTAFEDRIGACLGSVTAFRPSYDWQPSIDGDASVWIAPNSPIILNENFGSGMKELASGGRWYVRILPSSFDPEKFDNGAYAPPGIFLGGYSWGDTTGGRMTYSGSVRADNASNILPGATMWFRKTGEIWTAFTDIHGHYQGRNDFFGDHIPEQWVSAMSHGLKMIAGNGGIAPFRIRLGVTGLDGLTWPLQNSFGGQPPIGLESSMEAEFSVGGSNNDDWMSGFIGAWTELRRVFSMPPPNQTEIEKAIRKIG